MRNLFLVFVAYFLFFPLLASAQVVDTHARNLADNISNYFELYPSERMYVDIDKSSYISGDTIWFKSYVTAGFYNQLSPLSKVGYVNLVSDHDSIISKAKIRIDSGVGHGFISIPRKLKSSNYQMIGFTKWMIDIDSSQIFHKNIPIVNLFEQSKYEKKIRSNDITISFYPEGGNLVTGIENRVAFKLIGDFPKNDSLLLYSNSGDSIATIDSQWSNMGSFQFVPKEGERYYIQSKLLKSRFYLPDGDNATTGLFLINSEKLSDIRFKIYKGSMLPLDNVIILIHINGLVTYAADANFSKEGSIVGKVSKNLLRPGVNYLTVFTNTGIPILERAVFIDRDFGFEVSTELDNSSYSKRARIQTEIFTSFQGKEVIANLSMSVVRANESWDDLNEDNIISHFLLSSRLHGKVQHPWYYFNSADDRRYQNADLLMMVNGWSRYDYEKYLSAVPEEINATASIEAGLNLTGYLWKASSKKPIAYGTINYIIQDSSANMGVALTDSRGYFHIDDLKFNGQTTIILKGKNSKGKDKVKFEIDSALFHADLYNSFDKESQSEVLKIDYEALNNSLKYQETSKGQVLNNNFEMLEEVGVSSFKIDDQQQVNNLFGKGDYTLKSEDLVISQTSQHPLELIRGRISGVRVMGSINNWSIMIQGIGSINSSTNPLILVDNVEVNIDFLNSVSASQIKQVEVYKGATAGIFGVRGANGVLAFFTKNGMNDYSNYNSESVEVVIMEGYQEYKEFYNVKYDKIKNQETPDYRTVLSWEPSIKTSSEGSYYSSFYTSDVTGNYILIIEGITRAGALGFHALEFSVN